MKGWSGGETHNEPTALIIDILLQIRLTQMLGEARASTQRTNLIIHDGVTNIFYQATKSIHIPSGVQESGDPPSFGQWDEVLENLVEFSNNPCTSDRLLTLESVGLLFENFPPLFLLQITLRSRRLERLRQPFNSRYQQFYRLATGDRLL